ncbi:MAG: hypothetical protein AAB484_01245, partial [Patescibacteria group bacterium]
MNNAINAIVGCHVCVVKFIPATDGRNLPGEVVCGSDIAYFMFTSSHDVVINDDNVPCFGPGKASFLKVGDEIVAEVAEVRRGHFVITNWTHIKDWNNALNEIKARKEELVKPKPAPALPMPILEVAQVHAAVDKQNQTNGRDRRPVFKPTKKVVKTLAERSDAV